MKGTILAGYPCVGKTSLSKNDRYYIDLDSSLFKINPDHWWLTYVSVAYGLAAQGYTVFVSTHERVLDELVKCRKQRDDIEIGLVYPSPDMKDVWIKKAEDRYLRTKSPKDYRAFMRIKGMFMEDILHLESIGGFDSRIRITKQGYQAMGKKR